jgi:hypothetical protein
VSYIYRKDGAQDREFAANYSPGPYKHYLSRQSDGAEHSRIWAYPPTKEDDILWVNSPTFAHAVSVRFLEMRTSPSSEGAHLWANSPLP